MSPLRGFIHPAGRVLSYGRLAVGQIYNARFVGFEMLPTLSGVRKNAPMLSS